VWRSVSKTCAVVRMESDTTVDDGFTARRCHWRADIDNKRIGQFEGACQSTYSSPPRSHRRRLRRSWQRCMRYMVRPIYSILRQAPDLLSSDVEHQVRTGNRLTRKTSVACLVLDWDTVLNLTVKNGDLAAFALTRATTVEYLDAFHLRQFKQ
jgi:hypothetical protein